MNVHEKLTINFCQTNNKFELLFVVHQNNQKGTGFTGNQATRRERRLPQIPALHLSQQVSKSKILPLSSSLNDHKVLSVVGRLKFVNILHTPKTPIIVSESHYLDRLKITNTHKLTHRLRVHTLLIQNFYRIPLCRGLIRTSLRVFILQAIKCED